MTLAPQAHVCHASLEPVDEELEPSDLQHQDVLEGW